MIMVNLIVKYVVQMMIKVINDIIILGIDLFYNEED